VLRSFIWVRKQFADQNVHIAIEFIVDRDDVSPNGNDGIQRKFSGNKGQRSQKDGQQDPQRLWNDQWLYFEAAQLLDATSMSKLGGEKRLLRDQLANLSGGKSTKHLMMIFWHLSFADNIDGGNLSCHYSSVRFRKHQKKSFKPNKPCDQLTAEQFKCHIRGLNLVNYGCLKAVIVRLNDDNRMLISIRKSF
jgi:hypothetical protein